MKTIKKIFMFFSLTTILWSLSSCEETVTKEKHDNSMMELISMEGLKRDSLERMYIATLDEIDGNLDAVRDQYGLLILGPKTNSDLGISKKDQIINNISMINGLLADNKTKIEKLEKSLTKYKSGKTELIKSIEAAKERVLQQEKQIEEIKSLLAEKDFKIGELNQTVNYKNSEIESLVASNKKQEELINKTYFAYGTYKQLKEKQIVKKEGGVLGIKKMKVLNENLNKEQFVEMDKTKTTTIPMVGKNPTIISRHPVGTYTIETTGEEVATLTIKDPENFWKVSKYLVVEVH